MGTLAVSMHHLFDIGHSSHLKPTTKSHGVRFVRAAMVLSIIAPKFAHLLQGWSNNRQSITLGSHLHQESLEDTTQYLALGVEHLIT